MSIFFFQMLTYQNESPMTVQFKQVVMSCHVMSCHVMRSNMKSSANTVEINMHVTMQGIENIT